MKTNFHNRLILSTCFTLLLFFSFSFTSCKKETDNDNTIVKSAATDVTIGLHFVNAKTGEPVAYNNITTQGVTVVFSGQDYDKIVDATGSREFKTAQGFLSIALKSGITPTETNPIRFHIIASASDFFTTSMPVVLYEKGGIDIIVKMIELINPPDGVGMNVNTSLVTDDDGYVTYDGISFSTLPPVTSQEKTIASVTVLPTTWLKDKNNILVRGNIRTTLIYFNGLDDSSIEAIPGGYCARTNTNEDVFFTTGGFLSLELRESHTIFVDHVEEEPIQIKMEIPAATKDVNGVPVSAGATVPIWAYDQETGVWTFLSDAPVVTKTNGKLEVSFSITKIAKWGIGWKKNACVSSATVNVTGNISCTTNLFYELRNSATGMIIQTGMKNFASGTSFRFPLAPENTTAELRVFESSQNRTVALATLNISNVCSGTYTINVDLNPAPSSVNLLFNGKCSSRDNFVFHPTLPVYTKEIVSGNSDNFWQYAGYMIDGEITTCHLKQGKTYVYGIYYDERFYASPEYTINQNSYTFDCLFTSTTCAKF